MKNSKYIIFAPEFRPIPGGVSEYTLQLSKAFFRAGFLSFLFTNQFQKESFEFPIRCAWSSWNQKDQTKYSPIYRKSRSLLHSILESVFLFLSVLEIKIFHPKHTVIINSIFIDLSWKVIDKLTRFNIKYSLVIHGLDLLEWQKENPKKLLRLLEEADELILNSFSTQNLLKQVVGDKIKLPLMHVIHPPFDKVQYGGLNIKTGFGIDLSGKKVISTVCRLVKRKGIDLAIEAAQKVLINNPDWVYLIAGTGTEYSALNQLVVQLDLQNQILFLGAITHEQKYLLLEKSEVFIMPNHTIEQNDFEGFGISFVEAQYFRNAVIGGKSGGVIESVADTKSGFLIDFEKGDVIKSIESKLTLLMENSVLRQEMGDFAHQFVQHHFEIGSLVDNLKSEIPQ